MEFKNLDVLLDDSDIDRIEREIGLRFPRELVAFYKSFNGGEPEPYVFRHEGVESVISETLPLISRNSRRTAVQTYINLVVGKRIVEPGYFPFAVDAGGDYFFVDCSWIRGSVHYYQSDSVFSPGLVKVAESLAELFGSCGPEEE